MNVRSAINRAFRYVAARPFSLGMVLLLVLTLVSPFVAYHWKKWVLTGVVARLVADVSPWIAAQWAAHRAEIIKTIVDELFAPPHYPVPPTRPTAKKPPRPKRAHAEVKRKKGKSHAVQEKH